MSVTDRRTDRTAVAYTALACSASYGKKSTCIVIYHITAPNRGDRVNCRSIALKRGYASNCFAVRWTD